MTINELRQKKAELITQARTFMSEREKAGAFTADDQAKYDKIIDDALDCDGHIARKEALESAERSMLANTSEAIKPSGDKGGKLSEHRNFHGHQVSEKEAEKAIADYAHYLRTGESRALEAGSDVAGGFNVPIQQLSTDLLMLVDDQVHIRRLASIETLTSAESLGIVSLTKPSDYTWTSELATGTADSTMAFGKRELRPHPLAKSIRVSRKLLASSARPIVPMVNERFAYEFASTMESAYITGTGLNQPLGAFVASADGVSTGRDTVAATTQALTASGLIDCKFALKAAYWPNARWMFHRDAVKRITKLIDADSQFLFDIRTGTFLGFPLDVSEFCPNTFTTGLYVGMLADWKRGYKVVDALSMTMQRLDELYAATNQVGFISRYEGDGAPVQEEAFVRVKLD